MLYSNNRILTVNTALLRRVLCPVGYSRFSELLPFLLPSTGMQSEWRENDYRGIIDIKVKTERQVRQEENMNDSVIKDENARIRRMVEIDKSTLPADGGPDFNRLIFATSPYLLQHADNPVDWYPWGEDAFARAAAENKPIFLSIGYATCHWCHVMEHEAFEDREVAAAFNSSFVCIKVDREERPDIDEQYMTVAQMMTGSGGWPLNIFMTPEKKPFFAATYMPRTPRMGMPGIIQILDGLSEMWRNERQKLEESSESVIEALARLSEPDPGELPDMAMAENAFLQLKEMYDGNWGGFGGSPKFPMPLNLTFLLRFWKRTGNGAARAMVEHSLKMQRQGGIYDQIGFGFHRYAVDRHWLVPHFEKMLYDQALMTIACLEAFQATGAHFCRQTAEEIIAYVLGEMTSPEGGFFAGQDADTEGEEGTYYLWTPAEIAAAIGQDEAELFCRLFDVTEKGNFEGHNILHLPLSPESFAAREGVLPEVLNADLERWRQTLLSVRRKRIRPFRDEKVLTAWNGLMIAALARGYAVTGKVDYLDAADRAVAFVGTQLTGPGGRLLRSFHLGKAVIPGFLEDYAFFVWGLIELHQATLEPEYLDRASSLAKEMLRLFDGETGEGLYETGNDSEQLPVRQQSARDGVLPSGNGVAAFDLFRLGRITGDENFLRAGEVIVRTFMGNVTRQPLSALNLLAAADFHLGPEVTVTLSGRKDEMGEMLRVVRSRFMPHLILRHEKGAEGGFPAKGGLPTAYVCARGSCRPPITEPADLGVLLDEVG